MKIRALVVDDEPLARERVRELLAETPDFELAGECRDGREAVEAILRDTADVVFLDVQMPELDGFDVIEQVGSWRMPVVVFVTAFDRHALRAFDVHALDYLLKPFEDERFHQSLARAREAVRVGSAGLARRLSVLLQSRGGPDRLAIRSPGRIYFVATQDVDWIEAAGNYVRLHTGKTEHLMRESMASLEARLSPGRFARIHRSIIVNIDRIRELHALFHGDYAVRLEDGTELSLSRAYRPRLNELLGWEL